VAPLLFVPPLLAPPLGEAPPLTLPPSPFLPALLLPPVSATAPPLLLLAPPLTLLLSPPVAGAVPPVASAPPEAVCEEPPLPPVLLPPSFDGLLQWVSSGRDANAASMLAVPEKDRVRAVFMTRALCLHRIVVVRAGSVIKILSALAGL
jgi:hypothetical protein